MGITQGEMWNIKKYSNLGEGLAEILGSDTVEQDPMLHVLSETLRIARENLAEAVENRVVYEKQN